MTAPYRICVSVSVSDCYLNCLKRDFEHFNHELQADYAFQIVGLQAIKSECLNYRRSVGVTSDFLKCRGLER